MDLNLTIKEIEEAVWLVEKPYYKDKPVNIETFIEDEEYLGKIYGHGFLFPYWKKLLKKIYPTPFDTPYEEVILSAAIGAGKCVHKDTYISSSAGIKTIEQMYKDNDVGAKILTEDGAYPITAIFDNGVKEIKVIKTNKGKELKATPEHRFRVLTKDLKVEWKYVRDIQIGDNLIVACQEQVHAENKLPEDYAYFFGTMTGDQKLAQKLIPEGYCDDDRKRIPRVIFNACTKDIWEYISGLIDTDGYIAPTGKVSIGFKYEELTQGLGILASSLGLKYTLSKKYCKRSKTWRYCLAFTGMDTHMKLAQNLHLRLKYKAERLAVNLNKGVTLETLKLIKKYYPEIMQDEKDLDYLIKHNVTLETITEISSDFAQTYDLNIKDHPSYMINGFISHNSHVTSISMSYELYKLLMLKDPNKYYGLLQTDTIVFMLFAATQGTATDVNWGYISNILAVSPFFQENLDFTETKASYIALTEHIGVQIGSRAHKALGKAVLSAVLDEGNFGLIQDQVKNTYTAIMRRRGSRFKQGFKTPGIVWLASSPQLGSDFINERIRKASGNSKVYVVDNVPIWDVKAEKIKYCGKTFPVFLGDEVEDPKILATEDDALNYPADLIVRPPVEYYADFEADLLESIRDIAGRRVASSMNVFKSYAQLVKTFKKLNLFRADTMLVSLGTTLNDFQEYINLPLMQQLLADPSPRYIHLDSALTGDRYGIASCTCVSRDIYDSMTESIITKRYFVNDFAIGLEATNADGMPASVIARFLIWLRDQGYPIALITGDKPATTSIIPELKIARFKTEYLSVDTDRSPYLTLRQRINAGEYIGVNNRILIRELYNLLDSGDKIDHPDKNPTDGTKGCFVGSTKIKLLNGTSVTMEELAKQGPNTQFYVYGCTHDGEIIPALAYNAHKTKTVTELCCIELDNGEIIKCTVDHKFMLRNGSYLEAQKLKVGMSLMPLYSNKDRYERHYNNRTGNWRLTHQQVFRYFNGEYNHSTHVIHHYDCNPKNNDPLNLVLLSRQAHIQVHRELLAKALKPEAVAKRVAAWKKTWSETPEEIKAARRQHLSQLYKGKKLPPEQVQKMTRNRTPWNKGKAYIDIQNKYLEHGSISKEEYDRRLANWQKRQLKKYGISNRKPVIKKITKVQKKYIKNIVKKLGYKLYLVIKKYFELKFGKNWRTVARNKVCKYNSSVKRLNAIFWKSEKGIKRRQELTKKNWDRTLKLGGLLQKEKRKKRISEGLIKFKASGLNPKYIISKTQLKQFNVKPEEIGIDVKENIKQFRGYSLKELSELTKISEIGLRNILRNYKFSADYITCYNHKVKNIWIQEVEPTDVYDITVPSTENFALDSGVFVHNSKDISDSICGSFFSCFNKMAPSSVPKIIEFAQKAVEEKKRTGLYSGRYGSSIYSKLI